MKTNLLTSLIDKNIPHAICVNNSFFDIKDYFIIVLSSDKLRLKKLINKNRILDSSNSMLVEVSLEESEVKDFLSSKSSYNSDFIDKLGQVFVSKNSNFKAVYSHEYEEYKIKQHQMYLALKRK